MSREPPVAGAPAVITGASSGIGRALSLALGRPGRRLLLTARDAGRLRDVRSAVERAGGSVETAALDLTDDDAVDAWLGRISGSTGGVAALVHCAGTVTLGSVADNDTAVLDAHYAVNLRAPYRITRALLPALERARGHVVFVNSGAGLHANAGWSAYAASKFGLRALADSLRQEVAARGVRVTSVYPGRTATPMQARVHEQEGRSYDPGAFVRPEDVAEQVTSLLSVAPPSLVAELVIRPG